MCINVTSNKNTDYIKKKKSWVLAKKQKVYVKDVYYGKINLLPI